MDDYEIADCTGVLLGAAQFEDYMRTCAWTPSDRVPERVPLLVDFPKAEAFKDAAP